MVYTEGSHITADTEEELHTFAKMCGLWRNFYQGAGSRRPGTYWIFGNARKFAMRSGPQYVTKEVFEEHRKKLIHGNSETKTEGIK